MFPETDDQIRVQKASELVADRIRRRIVRGDLPVGTRLPPEEELMASFGVARTTLREALRVLEAQGLLRIRRGRGGGGVVTLPTLTQASETLGAYLQLNRVRRGDLDDARLMFEPALAANLARTQRPEDLAVLDGFVDAASQAAAADDRPAFGAAAAGLHIAIVERGGNITLATLGALLVDLASWRYATGASQATKEQMRRAAKSYAKLTALVRSGDPELVQAHWHSQLSYLATRDSDREIGLDLTGTRESTNSAWFGPVGAPGASAPEVKTSRLVANELRRRILSGQLQIGDRLPVEEELTAAFGIARTTLREALRILEAAGLITIRRGRGGGGTVTLPSLEHLALPIVTVLQMQHTTLGDLGAALEIIEPQLAGQLAVTRTAADLAAMNAIVSRAFIAAAQEDNAETRLANLAMHRLVIERAGNTTVTGLMTLINDAVTRSLVYSTAETSPDQLTIVAKSLRRLVSMVQAGDAAGATEHWKRHLAVLRHVRKSVADVEIYDL
ncbi:MAG: FadR/GntR family transcriptional regulator [Acidimicrobiia bacterium]